MTREGGPPAKNRVRVEVDFSCLAIRCLGWGVGRVGGRRGRARRRVGGRGGRAGGGRLRSAAVDAPSLPPRKLEDKWRGRLSPFLLPSPAGRGSAPGWGGGGPDACDWPRPHLGRPAPPPPSCWEQLLLSRRGAALGRRARSLEPKLGWGWGGLEAALLSGSPALTRQSPRNPLRPQPAPRAQGRRPWRELRRFPKTKTRALCVRPRWLTEPATWTA